MKEMVSQRQTVKNLFSPTSGFNSRLRFFGFDSGINPSIPTEIKFKSIALINSSFDNQPLQSIL